MTTTATTSSSSSIIVAKKNVIAVLATCCDLQGVTVMVGCDNTPAVAWRTKGSTTTNGPASYLLRESSIQERHGRYRSEVFYVPGEANTLVDIASRRFHLTDIELLALLNRIAPPAEPWQIQSVDNDDHQHHHQSTTTTTTTIIIFLTTCPRSVEEGVTHAFRQT